jgi:hypothetical protein
MYEALAVKYRIQEYDENDNFFVFRNFDQLNFDAIKYKQLDKLILSDVRKLRKEGFFPVAYRVQYSPTMYMLVRKDDVKGKGIERISNENFVSHTIQTRIR